MKKISIIISLMICIFSFNISFAQGNNDEEIKSIIKSFFKLADLVYEEEKYDISIDYYNDDNLESNVEIRLKSTGEYVYDFEIEDTDGEIFIYSFSDESGIKNTKKENINKFDFSKIKKVSDKIFLNYLNTYKKEYSNLFDINKFTYEISNLDDSICIYYYGVKNDIMIEDEYIELDFDDNLNLIYFNDFSDMDRLKELEFDFEKLNKLSKKDVIKKVMDSIDLKEGYLVEGNKKFNRISLKPCYFDINYLDRYIDLKDGKICINELEDFIWDLDSINIELDKDIESKLKSKAVLKDSLIDEEEAKKIALNTAKKYLSKGCYLESLTYDGDLEIYETKIKDKLETEYTAYMDIDKYGNIDCFDISYSQGMYSCTDEDIDYKNIYSNAVNLLSEMKPNLDNINLNAVIKKTKEPKVIFYENIEGKDILNSYIEFSYSGNYLEDISDNLMERNIDSRDIQVLEYKMSKKEAMNMIKENLEENYNHVMFYNSYLDRIYYKVEFEDDTIDATNKKFIYEGDYN